jgi:hypothetical protein
MPAKTHKAMTLAFREISMRLRSVSRANKVHTVATPMFQKIASKPKTLRTTWVLTLRLIVSFVQASCYGGPPAALAPSQHIVVGSQVGFGG